MAIVVVQATPHVHASAANAACVFGSNVTAGNQILVLTASKNRTTATVPTDTLTLTYAADQLFTESVFGSWNTCMYRATIGVSGGANTVTVPRAASDDLNAIAVEVSGLATNPLDKTPAGLNSSHWGNGTDNGTTTGTLTQADEIIFTMTTGRSAQQITSISTPSGFTALGTAYLGGADSINSGAHFAYQIVSATTAIIPAWISAGGIANFGAIITPTYMAAAAAGSRPVKMAGEWGGYAGSSGGFAG